MKGVIRRLASPETLGASTLTIVFLIYLAGSSSIVALTTSRNTVLDLGVSAISSVVMFLLLFACRTLFGQISHTNWRAAFILGIVVLANVLRTLAYTAIAEPIGFNDSLTRPSRVAGATLLTLAGMLVAGELIDRRRRFQSALADLSAKQQELSIERATYNERLQRANFELEANIRGVLDPALSLAALEFDRDSNEHSSVTSAQLLQEILRVRIRPAIVTLNTPTEPLSSLIDAPHNFDSLHVTETTSPPVARSTIDIVDSIRPALSVVPLRIIGIPLFISALGFVRGALAILFFSLAWPLLSVIRRMWPERFRILPVRTAIALLTACFLLAFGIPVLVAFVSSPELTDVVDRSALVWVAAANLLFSVGTAWFVATVFILARARRLTEEHLINVNEQLELSIARMRQEIWFTQQNLAWVLHGPVQSALTSATIRLESGAVRDAADRAAIWSSLKKAFELLTTAGPGVPNFNDFATELTDLWQGVCTISFIDSNKTMDCVAADPAATYAVIEVVRESVGNAIRHGDATTVDITINEQTEGLLDLVITDNGSGLSKDATPGIGSDLFDSLAYSWSRDSSGSSTTITAVLTWTPAL